LIESSLSPQLALSGYGLISQKSSMISDLSWQSFKTRKNSTRILTIFFSRGKNAFSLAKNEGRFPRLEYFEIYCYLSVIAYSLS